MKTALSLVCKIGIALALIWGTTNANAHTTPRIPIPVEGYSILYKNHLGPLWEAKAREVANPGLYHDRIIYYDNIADRGHEGLILVVHPLGNAYPQDDASNALKEFTKTLSNDQCTTKDIQSFSPVVKKGSWGFILAM